MNIGDRGPAPSWGDPPGYQAEKDCPSCLGYGCHECEFSGRIPYTEAMRQADRDSDKEDQRNG